MSRLHAKAIREAFTYTGPVPPWYRCDGCGAQGVKLWRAYGCSYVELSCVICACYAAGRLPHTVGLDGRRADVEYNVNFSDHTGRRWVEACHVRYTDQIGGSVPAVPDETRAGERPTWWGYTSVPESGCDWWRALPTRLP